MPFREQDQMEARIPTISQQLSKQELNKKQSRSRLKLVNTVTMAMSPNKAYDVAVIGLGYVGLPLCLAFAKSAKVLGVDVDKSKATSIQAGKSYIKHIASEDITTAVKNETFSATDDFSELTDAESILICVPTPLTINRTPELSYVENTAQAVALHLGKGNS